MSERSVPSTTIETLGVRSRNMRSIALAMCLAALIAGCAPSGSGGATYKIATAAQRSAFIHTALAGGVLGGQANTDGTACLWLGGQADRQALSWPYGYSARGNPLAVYDNAGNRVAAVGQSVTMAGGLLGDETHSILGCTGFTNFWGVGEVESAS